jgi:hypothetical protein
MSIVEAYRTHAEDCLRRAETDRNERDKPLWITLAQSWLQLAEHADRIGGEVKSVEQFPANDSHASGNSSA